MAKKIGEAGGGNDDRADGPKEQECGRPPKGESKAEPGDGKSDSEPSEETPSDRARKLRMMLKRLNKRFTFQAGEIVRWKPGLRNKKRPGTDEPAIVVKVLEEPVIDGTDKGAGSPYFKEELDIVIGLFDEDGDFIWFYFDSSRFEPMPV